MNTRTGKFGEVEQDMENSLSDETNASAISLPTA
jgi:hypothetical protein